MVILCLNFNYSISHQLSFGSSNFIYRQIQFMLLLCKLCVLCSFVYFTKFIYYCYLNFNQLILDTIFCNDSSIYSLLCYWLFFYTVLHLFLLVTLFEFRAGLVYYLWFLLCSPLFVLIFAITNNIKFGSFIVELGIWNVFKPLFIIFMLLTSLYYINKHQPLVLFLWWWYSHIFITFIRFGFLCFFDS